ncbi:nucleotide exchange factor GrpE [Arthrobacter castelli]|uniref:nucleotide exchange factor GrpE n=1 Tax=Arthrobacter castelli TaxID=271431 RepID=UPI000400F80B|nr:nucleotide exchange factor GrpE [Arthrobacter castelli]
MADENDPKVNPREDPENEANTDGEGASTPSPGGDEEIIEAEVVDDGAPAAGDAGRNAEAGDAEAGAAETGDETEAADEDGDALAQAEAILEQEGSKSETEVLAEERLADLQRLQAEYVNYRRRVERDRDVARDTAVISVLDSLLPVLDDIEAAREHGDLEGSPFASISNKLDAILGQHGLVRYGEVGAEFDPNFHEALMQQPSPEVEVETVSHVLRAGYRSGDRILRAAQVGVAVPE